MIEEINEQIMVLASFRNGKINPLLFSWRNRRYTNLVIIASWSDYDGQTKRFHFSVIADFNQANLYELTLCTRFFKWYLVKIDHE